MANFRYLTLIAGLSGLLLAPVKAQQQFAFEAVSVKPAGPDSHTETRRFPGGRFNATNMTLKALVQRAWDIKDFQVTGGPGWVNSERFDVFAKAGIEGTLTGEQLSLMIQAMLRDRFGLAIRREIKEMAIYSMVVAKGGSKLTPTTATAQTWSKGNGSLVGTKIPMDMLAEDLLESQLSRVVRDNTGIKGDFDIRLTWTPDSAEEAGPSLFTAIQEQLGLRLESAKGPVEMFVIERAEKPSAN